MTKHTSVVYCIDEDIDETYGVNVEFEESGDEDDGDENEVREDEGSDLSEGEEAKMDYTIQEKNLNKLVSSRLKCWK